MAIQIDPGDSWATKLAGPRSADVITVTNVGDTPHFPGNISSYLVAGDRFVLKDYVRLWGCRELTGLTEHGTYAGNWIKTSETGGPTISAPFEMWAGYEGGKHVEDLFLNGKPMRHIIWDTDEATTLPTLTPFQWTWDGVADKIYANCNDPEAANQTLLLSEDSTFISATVNDVTFEWENAPTTGDGRQLSRYRAMPRIEFWSTWTQSGVFYFPNNTGWHLNGIYMGKNHGGTVKVGADAIIENCRIVWSGQIGLGGSGNNLILRNNEIAWCNYAGYSPGWEAGAFKFTVIDSTHVYGNYVHHNNGYGMWWDYECSRDLIHHNFIEKNLNANIFYEANFGPAEIHHNYAADPTYEGWDGAGNHGPGTVWPWGSSILMSSSSNVSVHDNVVRYGRFDSDSESDGIGLIRQERGRSVTISAISKANPAVVTHTATVRPNTTGQVISFTSAVGMTELMNSPDADGEKRYLITVIDSTHFSLDGLDSSAFGTYTSSVHQIEWQSVRNSFSRNVIQCDRSGEYIMAVVDDHSYQIDALAYEDAALNKFTANAVYGNDWTGYDGHYGAFTRLTDWLAKANVEGDTATASDYVPVPVVVV